MFRFTVVCLQTLIQFYANKQPEQNFSGAILTEENMKNIFFAFIVVILLSPINLVLAQSEQNEKDEQKVDGVVYFNANFINPNDGENFASYDLNLYLLFNDKYGFGLDTTSCPKIDYQSIKPFATANINKDLNLVGGFLTDSTGADYVHAGFWYSANIGDKINIFIDPRFYLEVSDTAGSYFDAFTEISYLLNDKYTIAFDVVFDYWFESGNKWLLVGPIVYFKLSDSVSLYSRIACETDFQGNQAADIRAGLKWTF